MVLIRSLLLSVAVAAAAGCAVDPVTELEIDGTEIEAVVERYGPADSDVYLVVRKGELPYEYQSGMYNAVTEGMQEGDSVQVRQLVWEGWRNRAVWATEQGEGWRVVDAVEWPPWVRF